MSSFENVQKLPNIMFFDYPSYNPIYNNIVVTPPLTPVVSPSLNSSNQIYASVNDTSSTMATKSLQKQHKHVCHYNCGWSFKRYEHLKRHMLVHTGERPYTCNFPGCGKSFSRSDNFHAHCRTHTKKKQPKKNASASTKTSVTQNRNQPLDNSMATNLAANVAAVVSISQQFNYNPMYDHQQLEINNYLANCPADNVYNFVGYNEESSSPMSPVSPPTPSMSLLSHSSSSTTPFFSSLHHNYVFPSYMTPILSNQPDQNQNNQNKQSYNNKAHTCPVIQCSRKFKRLEHLKRHMRIHTLEKPYHCSFQDCQKSFSRSDNLSQHEKTHTRRKDESCK